MTNTDPSSGDATLEQEALRRFAGLVESVGVKRFAAAMGLSTRQINRMLSAAQPNPIERIIRCIQSADPEIGDKVLDYVCQEMGGHFVRMEAFDAAAVNAVKECAEAIAAISDGHVSQVDISEIRDAINALSGLILSLNQRHTPGKDDGGKKGDSPKGGSD